MKAMIFISVAFTILTNAYCQSLDTTKVKINWHEVKSKTKSDFEKRLAEDSVFQPSKLSYVEKKQIKTKEGLEYYLYDSYYKGIKIKGCSVTLLTKNEKVKQYNSRIPEKISFKGKDKKIDIYNIVEAIESDSIISQNIIYIQNEEVNNEFVLVWEINIIKKGLESTIYIDAENGNIIKEFSNIRLDSGIRSDTFETTYNGLQTAYFTCYFPLLGGKYWDYNYEKIKGGYISDGEENRYDYENDPPSNYSTNGRVNIVASGYWAAQKSSLYFKDNLSNDDALSIKVFYDEDKSVIGDDIAFYSSGNNRIVFSSGNSALDVIAHEYSHHITEVYSNGIFDSYYEQSGAIQESLSDIFARAIQYDVEGYDQYRIETIGEDILKSDNKILR